MSLMQSFKDFFSSLGQKKTYWIALSGGLDSKVLLHLAHALRASEKKPILLRAIHVNHGISDKAKLWEDTCASDCKALDIDFTVERVTLNLNASQSIEEAARDARYHAFAKRLSSEDVLFTAHHQDDQAETVLLQLLRGAGLKGLSAMPVLKKLGKGCHVRPFLQTPRAILEEYAKAHGLTWIEDEMNYAQHLTRNFLRHQVFPLLKTRWETVTQTLARSAKHCAQAQFLLDEFIAPLLAEVKQEDNALSVSQLLKLEPEKQQMVLRAWIHQAGYRLPGTKKLFTIQETVLHAAWDRRPCVSWEGVELRRHKDSLYLMPCLSSLPKFREVHWPLSENCELQGVGRLKAELSPSGKLSANIHAVTIKFRMGGEVISLGKRGRQKLKNLFQEWEILPWERDRVPLIFVEDELVGVMGYCLNPQFAAKENELGWHLRLELE